MQLLRRLILTLSIGLLGNTPVLTHAAEPAVAPTSQDAVLAKLKANGINVGSFTAERITISKGTFTRDGLAALAALPKLQELVFYAPNVEPRTFAALSELKGLKKLQFTEYPVTDEVLEYAGAIPDLKSLEVSAYVKTSQPMTAEGINGFLAKAENLNSLVLLGCPMDDAALIRVGQMSNMTRFWTDSPKISAEAWSKLAGLTAMRDLYLRGTTFNDEGMRAVGGMKELKSLMLDNTQVTDAGLVWLADLTKIADLGLMNTKVTDNGMENLKGLVVLHNLYVAGTPVTAQGLRVLPHKAEMSMIRIGRRPLTLPEHAELLEMFPKSEIFDPAGYWNSSRIRAGVKQP